ncbi:hypothetical protein WG906_04580 [Pedobacter sp. P351]|uniref:hypothetical protein n=1 Tax=Pedobacter superstes TaxID=3133441 RepID=UPI0030A73885
MSRFGRKNSYRISFPVIVSFNLVSVQPAHCQDEKRINSSHFSAQLHPRIFTAEKDKGFLVDKIKATAWAGNLYEGIKREVQTLVERHKTDTQYVVSRLRQQKQ